MAGRPKRADKYGGHIARAEDAIADRLPELIENLFRLAAGVVVQEEKDGQPRIYTRPPDRQSNEYLINRVAGKPVERVEHAGEDGDPLFPPHMQRRMLDSPEALTHACDLDAVLSAPGDDPGGLCEPGERGTVDLPPAS